MTARRVSQRSCVNNDVTVELVARADGRVVAQVFVDAPDAQEMAALLEAWLDKRYPAADDPSGRPDLRIVRDLPAE